ATPPLRGSFHAGEPELPAIRLRVGHDGDNVVRVEPLRAFVVLDDVLDSARLVDVDAIANRDLRVDERVDLLRRDELATAQRSNVPPNLGERNVAMLDLSAGLLVVHPSEQRHSV